MRCRAYRPEFTEREFNRHSSMFWRMPRAWGLADSTGTTSLRHLYEVGGIGAVSLVPILGRYATWEKSNALALSQEECSRLAGCDADTLHHGANALSTLGLATRSLQMRHGRKVTVWNVNPAMAAPSADDAYFRYSSRLIYGGNWSRLSGTQRALYLGAATRARTTPDSVHVTDYLDRLLPRTVDRSDLLAAFAVDAGTSNDRAAGDPSQRYFRSAIVSVAELHDITGLSESAIHVAANAFKRAEILANSKTDDASVMYSPLAVYPTTGGRANLYVFRDHADHWPWDLVGPAESAERAA